MLVSNYIVRRTLPYSMGATLVSDYSVYRQRGDGWVVSRLWSDRFNSAFRCRCRFGRVCRVDIPALLAVPRNAGDSLPDLLESGSSHVESGAVEDNLITASHNAELLRWVLRNRRTHAIYTGLDAIDPVIGATILRLSSEDRMSRRLLSSSDTKI